MVYFLEYTIITAAAKGMQDIITLRYPDSESIFVK
jgi:hypothetical protein